jgi:hypothetical protein
VLVHERSTELIKRHGAVMFARFSAAVLPTLCAQAPGERIHSGKPAGASNSGISIRSSGAKESPYGTSGPGTSGCLISG